MPGVLVTTPVGLLAVPRWRAGFRNSEGARTGTATVGRPAADRSTSTDFGAR